MQGFNALWMPGTDHAGIATQAVVERRLLEEEKLTRHDLGPRRARRSESGSGRTSTKKRILGQLKQIGCSCDWERLRFTLDDQCCPGRPRDVLPSVQGRQNLPRQAAGELGHVPADGRQRRRGVSGAGEGPLLALQVSGDRPEAGRADARHDRHDAARDDARRHGGGGASRSGGGVRQGRRRAARETARRDRQGEGRARRADRPRCSNAARRCCRSSKQLRDMAKRGVMLELPLTGRQIPLDRRRMGEAGARLRLREDHAGPRRERLRRRAAASGDRRDQHHEPRRHAQRQRAREVPRPEDAHDGPRGGGRRHGGGRPVRSGEDREDREIELPHSRSLEDADRAVPGGPVVREDGRARAIGDGRRDRRPREDHAGAVCEDVSRLARRETRLAGGPAAVVGTSDSGLDRDVRSESLRGSA